MDRKAVAAGLLLALMLHACDRAAAPPEPTTTPAEPSVAAPQAAEAAGVDLGPIEPTPSQLTPEAERGVKGARNLLLSFARAIEREEFGQAWGLLAPGDRRKWPQGEFARQFADLRQITVAVPDGTMEGACGSSYYTAPLAISGSDKDGRPLRYEGEAVLRRVTDVEGATPAQLRWHFERLTLDWTH